MSVPTPPQSPRQATMIDYTQPSLQQRYGPTASANQVPSTASLLGDDLHEPRSLYRLSAQSSGSRMSGMTAGTRLSSMTAGTRLSVPYSLASYDSRPMSAISGAGWGWNDPEADDYLHNPDPKRDRKAGSIFTIRGITNIGCLFILLLCLITLFAGYPIITAFTDKQQAKNGAFNLGGVNASGQVPLIENFPQMIDEDTPADVKNNVRIGFDGHEYTLVFSDEFEKEGRTFYHGDDPFWEAVDFHYWPTGDLEWYDPEMITTEGGHLKITLVQERNHDLNFRSGMLQSWNKLCFQWSYYMEVAVILPGSSKVGGFWPGVWTMGNLGRPGYGGSTDGLWPYTYDSCDVGTLWAQVWPNGTDPKPATWTGGGDKGQLSTLPGQRLSSCTCPGEDHPGPSHDVGRGAPEVDLIEAQIWTDSGTGTMSQSFQVAPFDDFYQFKNRTSDKDVPSNDVYVENLLLNNDQNNFRPDRPGETAWNPYLGGPLQQAVSGLTSVPSDVYYEHEAPRFNTYGVEVFADPNDREHGGHITWMANGKKSWTVRPSAVRKNDQTQIGQRLIPEEPMTMIFNLGMSDGFQAVDVAHMNFPNYMLVDYVRVWQRKEGRIGCDPADHPTAKYIADHPDIYNNANITTWKQAGYKPVKNRLINKC